MILNEDRLFPAESSARCIARRFSGFAIVPRHDERSAPGFLAHLVAGSRHWLDGSDFCSCHMTSLRR